jgi:hypothetical protein
MLKAIGIQRFGEHCSCHLQGEYSPLRWQLQCWTTFNIRRGSSPKAKIYIVCVNSYFPIPAVGWCCSPVSCFGVTYLPYSQCALPPGRPDGQKHSTVKPLLSDARSSDSRINRPNFNQVVSDRFVPARVG